ncbi:MAG: hypothetical protein Q9184_007289, partial [Pyrenodesmia sp. 2 TL-2023]
MGVAGDSDNTEAASETENWVEPDFVDHGGPVIVDTDADSEPSYDGRFPSKEEYEGDEVLRSMRTAMEAKPHWSPHDGKPCVNSRLIERCPSKLEAMSTKPTERFVKVISRPKEEIFLGDRYDGGEDGCVSVTGATETSPRCSHKNDIGSHKEFCFPAGTSHKQFGLVRSRNWQLQKGNAMLSISSRLLNVFLFALVLFHVRLSSALYPVQQIYQFPNNTVVQNLAVRPDGSILTTLVVPTPDLYLIQPNAKKPDPQLLYRFNGSALSGITQTSPDVYYVTVATVT